jgi:hypothetical protein
MKNKKLSVFLFSVLIFKSTGSLASLIIDPELLEYSAISTAALSIESGAVVESNLAAGAAVSIGAGASTQNIYSGAAISMGASTTAKDLNGNAAVTIGAGATYTSLKNETLDVVSAIEKIDDAQLSLYDIESDYLLDATIGNVTFNAGVYEGAALTTAANSVITLDGKGEIKPVWIFNLREAFSVGANNTFEIINADEDAGVIWNIGGALTLGAGTSFIGTTFVHGAISGGAGSSVSCGNLYSKAAISIGSITSKDCIGFYNGIASKSRSLSSVTEPSTMLIILGSLVLLFIKRKSINRDFVRKGVK